MRMVSRSHHAAAHSPPGERASPSSPEAGRASPTSQLHTLATIAGEEKRLAELKRQHEDEEAQEQAREAQEREEWEAAQKSDTRPPMRADHGQPCLVHLAASLPAQTRLWLRPLVAACGTYARLEYRLHTLLEAAGSGRCVAVLPRPEVVGEKFSSLCCELKDAGVSVVRPDQLERALSALAKTWAGRGLHSKALMRSTSGKHYERKMPVPRAKPVPTGAERVRPQRAVFGAAASPC